MNHTRAALCLGLLLASPSAWTDDGAKPEARGTAWDAQRAVLNQGTEVMKAGDPQRAITDYFAKVIAGYETEYPGSDKTIYSAQNQMQTILYVALPQTDKKEIVVLDSVWADAYLLKAYALTELGKREEARTALESAIALSPMSSQYLSELAYTYQADKNWDKSIETYRQAADIAEFGSADETKSDDLCRAWRGEGFDLVELGKLDDAEALYHKCLELNPKDNKSQGELRYIEQLRKR